MRPLTLSLLLFSLIAMVSLGWIFDRAYWQYMTQENNKANHEYIHLKQLAEDLAQNLSHTPDRTAWIRNWQSKHQVKLSLISSQKLALPESLRQQLLQESSLLLETESYLLLHFMVPESDDVLLLKYPQKDKSSRSDSIGYVFTLLFYIAIIFLFFLWLYPLIRQLLTLRQTAKSFGEGDLTQRIAKRRFSYIQDIEKEFNHMAQRIEDLVADVKLLSKAVSHDLRTPLARIRFGIDTLQEVDEPEIRRRFEDKISHNVDTMTELVETLLDYARLDQAMFSLSNKKVDLVKIVLNSINSAINDAVKVEFIAPENEHSVIGDQRYLSMMVNNLLQNAILYSNQKVKIQLINHRDTIELIVSDNGEGIEACLQDNIFKPFIRGSHGSDAPKGHGIGLAVVKRIVEWHRGIISVDRCDTLLGAKFTVSLPKN